MSDFDVNDLFDMPGLEEPRPDEDAWEAYLDFALERIGGDRSPGLKLSQIAELESLVHTQLPFEVGLLLVMGVPDVEPWHQWQDPASDIASWNARIRQGIAFDIEHNDFWFIDWGARPDALDHRLGLFNEQFEATVPALFPLYGDRAMPLVAASGQENSDGNPVLSVHHTQVDVVGTDLAAWMHREFDVPLPMWPAEERTFPFWG